MNGAQTMSEPGLVEMIDRFCKEEGPRGQDFVLLSEAETRGYWEDVKSRRAESIYAAGRTFGLEDAKPRVRVEWSEAGEDYRFVVNRDECSYVFTSPLQIADFFRGFMDGRIARDRHMALNPDAVDPALWDIPDIEDQLPRQREAG